MKKEEKDYIKDIAEIRSIMERSTKFFSLSGWAGIMAGVYAIIGAVVASKALDFWPDRFDYAYTDRELTIRLFILSIVVLSLAIVTAMFDSSRKAKSKGERAWNATSRRLLVNMLVPLFTGGALIVYLIFSGYNGLAAPLTLIFYGLALFNAGNFTFRELKITGIIQIILGLLNLHFISFGLVFWIMGFGIVHIIYGVYMHLRYAK